MNGASQICLRIDASPQMENQQPELSESPFNPRQIVLRWLIITLAIFGAIWLVPGIQFEGPGWQIGVVAIVFTLFNAALNILVRPLVVFLTVVTLGAFGFIVNACLLAFSSAVATSLDIHFHVNGLWNALLGGLVMTLVRFLLSFLVGLQRIVVKVQQGDGSLFDDKTLFGEENIFFDDDNDDNDDNDDDHDDNERHILDDDRSRTTKDRTRDERKRLEDRHD